MRARKGELGSGGGEQRERERKRKNERWKRQEGRNRWPASQWEFLWLNKPSLKLRQDATETITGHLKS